MYLSHYSLAEKPFGISTDPKFLWLGEKHKEALAILKYGVVSHMGFLLLTGEVGTGKTTLVNALLESLDDAVVVANVTNPKLDLIDFCNLIAKLFEIPRKFNSKANFIIDFTRLLQKAHSSGKHPLLIIDEAHTLSRELLEHIRLLSNIELPQEKLIDILFVGQPELNRVLLSPEFRALRQRIVLVYNIDPLSESETRQYIEYRLRVAGAQGELFNPKALHEIHRLSKGIPRVINTICDHALLTGYTRELKDITPTIIRECHRELLLPGETKQVALSVLGEQPSYGEKRTGYFKKIIAPLKHQRFLYGAAALSVVIIAILFTLLAQKDLFSKSDQQNPTPRTVRVTPSAQGESGLHPTIKPKNDSHIASEDSIEAHLTENSVTPKQTVIELAQEALEEKDFARVVELLDNNTSLKPGDMLKARVLYAQALQGQAYALLVNYPNKAEVLLRKAVQSDPQNARAYFDLGKIYTKSKHYPKAIQAYEMAADLDPSSPDAFFNLGFTYAATKDYGRAEKMFLRVTELKPHYLDKALFNLAIVQQKQGKTQQSVENLEEALAVNPDNSRARKYLNRIKDTRG
jgi:type II secretory pathway predicted ATPase ExeA/Tfp pilus assembly protein PilF